MSMPAASAVSTSSTTTGVPSKSTVLPAERTDANRRSSRIGNERSARISRITVPTCPVAPTMAIENPESEIRVMSSPWRGDDAPGSAPDADAAPGADVRVAASLPVRRTGRLRRDRPATGRRSELVDVGVEGRAQRDPVVQPLRVGVGVRGDPAHLEKPLLLCDAAQPREQPRAGSGAPG